MDDDPLVVKFSKASLNGFLTCRLCGGYLRFAHTIIECGHSFCRLCLFDTLKNAKNPKCPTCEVDMDKNFTKSIRKDPYKQSIVDLLYPEFQTKDAIIIKRCKELFPDIEIEAIKDEYDYMKVNWLPGRKKKVFENKFKTDLQSLVSDNFNMTLNEFSKQLLDDAKYAELIKKKQQAQEELNRKVAATTAAPTKQDIMVKEEEKENFTFSLFPKTDEDYKIVSIRNSMKVNDKNSNIEQVRKYLFKHINKRCAPDPNNPNDPNKQMLASLFDISQLTSEKILLHYDGELISGNMTLDALRKKNPNSKQFTLQYEIMDKRSQMK